MSSRTSRDPEHLSEEALDDVLIGMGSEESAAHLAICALCHSRVAAFQADLKQMDESSMAWSRVRAAGMKEVPKTSGVHHWPLATIGSAAAAAVLLLAVVVPGWRHSLQTSGVASNSLPPATMEQPESATQIAADNQLLEDIDAAVNTNEASPFGDMLPTGRRQAQQKAQPQ